MTSLGLRIDPIIREVAIGRNADGCTRPCGLLPSGIRWGPGAMYGTTKEKTVISKVGWVVRRWKTSLEMGNCRSLFSSARGWF